MVRSMKWIVWGVWAVLGIASPASALKVTNLDTVPHRIALSDAGSVQHYVIAPGATENLTGASQGRLSLVSASAPQKAQDSVLADGLLSGVIGVGRNQDIPADALDNFVIWPGGELRLQGRTKRTQAP